MGAEELVRRGKRPRGAVALAALAPCHFLRYWLLGGSVMNGVPGFAWAFMLTATSVMKHLKVRELLQRRVVASPPALQDTVRVER